MISQGPDLPVPDPTLSPQAPDRTMPPAPQPPPVPSGTATPALATAAACANGRAGTPPGHHHDDGHEQDAAPIPVSDCGQRAAASPHPSPSHPANCDPAAVAPPVAPLGVGPFPSATRKDLAAAMPVILTAAVGAAQRLQRSGDGMHRSLLSLREEVQELRLLLQAKQMREREAPHRPHGGGRGGGMVM